MNVTLMLKKVFEAYLEEYGPGFDRATFIDFVVAQLTATEGVMDAGSLIGYYRGRADELQTQLILRTARMILLPPRKKTKPPSRVKRRKRRGA